MINLWNNKSAKLCNDSFIIDVIIDKLFNVPLSCWTLGEMKVEMDSGTKSEGEEDSQAFLGEKKTSLGRTPNHLTLSTTSTISAGSTGSQARLIQSSHQPENYIPITVKELGECIVVGMLTFPLKLTSSLFYYLLINKN